MFLALQWLHLASPGSLLHRTLRLRQASHALFCLRDAISIAPLPVLGEVVVEGVDGGPLRDGLEASFGEVVDPWLPLWLGLAAPSGALGCALGSDIPFVLAEAPE